MNPTRARVLSPKTIARLIGVLTLFTIAGGIYALMFVGDRLIAWRDPAATAANILANKNLYLSAVAVFLVEQALSLATTVLSYLLLRPAGRTIALVTLCMGLAANVIKTGARVLFAAPVYLLGSTRYPTLGVDGLNELSLLLLQVGDHAAGIAMAFIGIHFVLNGWLILRSTFLPKFLGVLAIAGGLAWLTHLWPPLGYRVGMVGMLVGLVAVVAQVTWYLAVGVNEERWHAQAEGGAEA
jgi:hypothetical protein